MVKLHIVFGALLLAGCSAGMEGGEEGTGNVPDTTADVISPTNSASVGAEAPTAAQVGEESDKALCLNLRSDAANPSFVTVQDGNWGSYADCSVWCPDNSFAYEIALKAMPNQNGFDDAAVTGIRLTCKDRSTGATTVRTANEFAAGSWLSPAYCSWPSKPIVSGRMLLEAPQGSGTDDTSTNGLKIRCRNDANEITVPSLTSWGSWRSAVACPAGSAVCGINTRLEGTAQDAGRDDTALNGLRFECCTF